MTSILFNAVRDTLFDLLGDDKYLGAEPGLIAALHTWGQTLILHPHIHCLITGGGLTKSGQWLPVINNYLLPSRVVMALFRKKFTYAMHKAFLKGKIKLPPNMRPQQFLNLLNKLRHKKLKKWNVRILAPYLHGAGVVTYLARYMRGGPIKNSRIISFDGWEVKFQYFNNHVKNKNGNGKKAVMKLSTEEFIDRLLQHAPQPRTQVVRFYGLYHHSKSEKLDLPRKQMGQPPYEEPEKINWREYCSERGDDHPERCPECGKGLVILYSTEGRRIPIPERLIRHFQAGGAPPRQYLEKAA